MGGGAVVIIVVLVFILSIVEAVISAAHDVVAGKGKGPDQSGAKGKGGLFASLKSLYLKLQARYRLMNHLHPPKKK